MKNNIGKIDKVIRISLAVLGLLAVYKSVETISFVYWIIGGLLIGTSLISFCPVYAVFGLRTTKNKEK